MPADEKPGSRDREFPTQKAAWKYIFSRMCNGCRQQRSNYLNVKRMGLNPDELEPWWDYNEYPACSAEWGVCRKREYLRMKKRAKFYERLERYRIRGR